MPENREPRTTAPARPVVLVVRDGWGENPNHDHDAFNAIKLASTPVADRLDQEWPRTLVRTCGEDVGLPTGTMGNSEVGHQNIGAGRIVDQELMRITRAIRDGSFHTNESIAAAFQHADDTNGAVHLLGLVSDGQVHSDLDHLLSLIECARRAGVDRDKLFVHVITDGRDTGPTTGLGFVETLEQALRDAGVGRIASVIGRYYAMDRDHRWERVAWAYATLTGAAVAHEKLESTVPIRCMISATEAIKASYASPEDPNLAGDEFIAPTRVINPLTLQPIGLVRNGDAVIFFNFRGDRPREITKAFVLDDDAWATVKNGGFQRGRRLRDLHFCTMTGYEAGLPVTSTIFDKPPKMPDILGEVVSDAGLTQFRAAETEKFPHVTFFFNDYREDPFHGEQRGMANSPQDVATYDLRPEMAADAVCDSVIARLESDDCEDLIIVNFANPDMVGHTGNLDAVVKAVETTDRCVGRLIDATLARGGALVITADHGNAEQMWNTEQDCPHTAHTTYDVPLYVVDERVRGASLRDGGRLADIAPTVLDLMGLARPDAMTGRSLIETLVARES